MEKESRLKSPSGSIHDIRYLYTVIAGIKKRNGNIDYNEKALGYFRKLINDYNDAKSAAYGLSYKPREVNLEVVKDAVSELATLNIITRENGRLSLTEVGRQIASLIEQMESLELKKVLAKLMLERYSIFEMFLRRLKVVSGGNGVPIPIITSDVFDNSNGDPRRIAEKYISLVNQRGEVIMNPQSLYEELDGAGIETLEKRTTKIDKIQAILERFIVSAVFQEEIRNRRSYDFVRSRTTFLELTNYGIFDIEGHPVEVTYLVSDFQPSFPYKMETLSYSEVTIYLNRPTYTELREAFKSSVAKNYGARKDEFGYARIADIRDLVCKELKLSDTLFDTYIKRLYEDEPHWLSFTYSGAQDKVTEKRLPIVLKEPMREFFTLVKVNESGFPSE